MSSWHLFLHNLLNNSYVQFSCLMLRSFIIRDNLTFQCYQQQAESVTVLARLVKFNRDRFGNGLNIC